LTGGSALSTGNNFTTPSISTTTTYYIDCTVSGCTSSSRSSAVATITPCSSATITSTGTLSPFSTCAGVASSSQTFSISGTSLTADIVLTAPTGYELSIDAGANYFATLTLTQLRGVVTSTTVYVRLKSDATNGASGNVSATSTGATTVNVATGTGVVIALPTFSNQPSSSIQNLCLNQPATALTVSVSGGSGYSYKWYSNTTNTNSGGSEIGGATNASYTPTTSAVGTTYYYCVVSYTSCGVSSPGKPNGPLVASPTITSNISGAVIVGGLPTFSSQPSSSIQNLCLNQPATALTVSVSGGSGYSYKWYSNTTNTNSGGSEIGGATNASYTPTTSAVGTTYYYCVVSYTSCGVSSPGKPNGPLVASPTITSNISGAVIVGGLPTFSSQPSSSIQNLCLNQPATALTVSVSGGSGYSYKWYSNTTNTNSGGSEIGGATNASYTPTTSVVGTTYYYCVVSYTSCGVSSPGKPNGPLVASPTITSNISGAVIVGGLPTFSSQPSSSIQNLCLNQPATALTVSVSGGSGYSYKWYSNTTNTNSGGSEIGGATNASYTPTTSAVGTTYYYCVVSYTSCGVSSPGKPNGPLVASPTITSNISGAVIVGGLPTFSSQPLSSIQNLCLNQPATALTVSVSGGSGSSYKWYSNTTNTNSGGSEIGGATNASYTPTTSAVGTTYYYCVVSYTSCGVSSPVQPNGPSVASPTITSNISGAVIVTICSSPPTISSISSQTINRNSSTTAIGFTISDVQTPAADLILNVASSDTVLMPRSRIVLAGSDNNRTIQLTPVLGKSGNSQITISVTDTDNLTSSTNFSFTVNSQDPTIGVLPDQIINVNSSTQARNFAVRSGVATSSITASSSNSSLVPTASISITGTGATRSIVITPTPGLVGNSVITIEVNYADGSSEFIVFTLTVVNTVPYLSPLKNVNLCLTTIATVPFVIGDNETPAEDLRLTITSSNSAIIKMSEIQVTGTGQNKILTLSPSSKQFGSSLITITVNDNSGTSSTQTFTFTLNPCDGDNDGISDEIECPNFTNCPDSDGDGTPNYLDTDSDNDGIGDAVEKNIDSDGDSIPDYLDTDSDNDGIPDSIEGYIDSDGDGIMNYLDLDSDGDGIEDRIESYIDSDRDGIPNYLDLDSDNDGINDRVEGVVDTDGDGSPNYIDGDSDNDGIPDGIEGRVKDGKPVDSDADGKPDYIDLDSDNDGIPDSIEKNTIIVSDGKVINQPLDSDGDGKPDYLDLDSDNDGIPDSVEAGPNPNEPIDSDGDVQPNYLDLDSDNDGIPDKVEAGSNPNVPVDTDGDGKPDYLDLDSDNDGIPDKVEAGSNPNIPVDTDGDGKPDYLDLDSDNDSIPDKVEAGKNPNIPVDTDGDVKPDYLDLDSDNDGIPDKVEAGSNPNIPVDSDGDSKPDYIDLDSDNDTIPDKVEAGVNPNVPVDSDGDGKPDYLDLDSDNDSIPDKVEAGINPNIPVDTDGDGKPDYLDLDSDNDGIPDKVEAGTNPNIPVDSDGDGKPDYIDLDSDNDGIPDKVEAGSNPNVPIDTDKDGKPNYLDLDSDNDTIPDKVEAGSRPSTPVDTDSDGNPDYIDLDSDNDSIPDKVEAGINPNVPVDTDGDGKPDYLDIDSDNDTILDSVEAGINPNLPVDTDGDGIMNFRDTDSDNDKILDKLEDDLDFGNISDCDNDNVPNYIDADQCETFTPEGISPNGDGKNDVLIIPGIKSKNNNRIAIYNRWGSLVFEKENYQNDWGGEANVKNIVLETDGLLPDGTYYYIVLFDNKQATKASYIYINRLNN
jgi:large repetitive protein